MPMATTPIETMFGMQRTVVEQQREMAEQGLEQQRRMAQQFQKSLGAQDASKDAILELSRTASVLPVRLFDVAVRDGEGISEPLGEQIEGNFDMLQHRREENLEAVQAFVAANVDVVDEATDNGIDLFAEGTEILLQWQRSMASLFGVAMNGATGRERATETARVAAEPAVTAADAMSQPNEGVTEEPTTKLSDEAATEPVEPDPAPTEATASAEVEEGSD